MALVLIFTQVHRTVPWDSPPVPLHSAVNCSLLLSLPFAQGSRWSLPRGEIISPLVTKAPSWPMAENKDTQGRKCGAAGGRGSEGSELALLSLSLEKKILLVRRLLLTLVLQSPCSNLSGTLHTNTGAAGLEVKSGFVWWLSLSWTLFFLLGKQHFSACFQLNCVKTSSFFQEVLNLEEISKYPKLFLVKLVKLATFKTPECMSFHKHLYSISPVLCRCAWETAQIKHKNIINTRNQGSGSSWSIAAGAVLQGQVADSPTNSRYLLELFLMAHTFLEVLK